MSAIQIMTMEEAMRYARGREVTIEAVNPVALKTLEAAHRLANMQVPTAAANIVIAESGERYLVLLLTPRSPPTVAAERTG